MKSGRGYMAGTTDFLMTVQGMVKLHDGMIKMICGQYRLTLIEGKIISFLHNNPGKDTAGDIVELRKLSKGNVSLAVESLIQKGLLEREQDHKDRRKIHLSLLPAAKPITDLIEKTQNEFEEELFRGFSEEERRLYVELNDRMVENTKNAMKRRMENE